MNKFARSSFSLTTEADMWNVSAPRVVEVKGTVSVDDVFAGLERRARQGCIEHVTFDAVGMTVEDMYA